MKSSLTVKKHLLDAEPFAEGCVHQRTAEEQSALTARDQMPASRAQLRSARSYRQHVYLPSVGCSVIQPLTVYTIMIDEDRLLTSICYVTTDFVK